MTVEAAVPKVYTILSSDMRGCCYHASHLPQLFMYMCRSCLDLVPWW